MSGPELTVGTGVIAELVRLAAFEVPGVARVGRGGPAWRGWLAGPAVRVRVRDDRVLVRLRIVARPGSGARAADRPGPDRGRRDRRAPARARPRRRHGHRRWRRRLTSQRGRRTGTSARARRGLRGRLRPAHRGGHPRAPPGRDPSATRRPPRWPASSSRPWSRHRDEIDAAIDRGRPAVPGHRPRQDGPRAAPYRHR